MAMFLGAFASEFARILSQMAEEEVARLLGVGGEIRKLSRMVHRIQGVLVDVDRRQTESEAIRRCMLQLKDAMYDADDVIDLCRINTTSGSSSSFLSRFRNPLLARRIAGRLEEINSRIDAIVRDLPLLGLVEHTHGPPGHHAGRLAFDMICETSPVVVPSDFVGEQIEDDSRKLVEWLMGHRVGERQGDVNVPVVAIVGMGGIGKTTLAKKVYHDPTIMEEFKSKIWICVSKDWRPEELVKNIIRELKGDYGGAKKISELLPKLKQCVEGKKFLLVLDNIWRESEQIWCDLLRPSMINGASGSRVLITTRDEGVAAGMRAKLVHKVQRLSDADAVSLLINQVIHTGSENEIEDLKDIGMQLVERCNGLPLAIKSIGGLLRMKRRTSAEWRAVLKSNLWSTEGLPDDIHHALNLSYEDLPLALKQCFIFCSLFAENHVFSKTELIYNWQAEGILPDKESFWELGNEYYRELLLRNIFEDTGVHYDQGECRIHDVLLSFARHLGKDENSLLRERENLPRPGVSPKLRRLSIQGDAVNTESIKKHTCLRTLLLLNKPEIALNEICKAVLNLRMLNLSGSNVSTLPNSLTNLVHLRYLNVCHSKLNALPNSIGNLKTLVYLSLGGCKELSHIPHSITNLRELRYLNVYRTKVVALPKGLTHLQNLIDFHGFKPAKNSLEEFSSLDELKDLSQLVTLIMAGLEKVSDVNVAKGADLFRKEKLRDLHFVYTSLSANEQVSQSKEKKLRSEEILSELSPPPSLEILHIIGYFGLHLPNWLSLDLNHLNLRCIEIIDCACFEKLAPLGQLRNLDYLRIAGAHSVESVGEEFFYRDVKAADHSRQTRCRDVPGAFPNLTKLAFDNMPNWKEWHWNKGEPAMRKLKKLIMKGCFQLRSLPEGLSHHANSLEYLEIKCANNLINVLNLPQVKDILVSDNSELKEISNLPNISYIGIKNCPNLRILENCCSVQRMELWDFKMETFPEYLMAATPKKLTIRCCDRLFFKTGQEKNGDEWHKFEHIPEVKLYTENESLYGTYKKTSRYFSWNGVSRARLI